DYAILLLDREGNIENWNTGAERIKGYMASEIIGKNFSIFYTAEDRASGLPKRLLQEAYDNGRAAHEGKRIRKDGTVFWGSIIITALHDDEDNVVGFSKVTRDLTEKKLAEDKLKQYAARLEQKNQELEEFGYVASHDLKEPLRKIITFGDLLQHNYSNTIDERANTYIARMQDAARRMMSLIDDLLQFSLVDKDSQIMQETDLNHVMERVVQDLEPAIQSRNASVSFSSLPCIMARPLQMQQLFQNLIANALKFNDKEDPAVAVTYNLVEGENESDAIHRISVEDNGIGFLTEDSTRIFEAFRRLHGRSEYAGSGIGLAICKKIVEMHNGTIYATGQKGQGATFTIEFPVSQTC
ncbi:MAG: ATP-binding protein, partial [Chitinophagaceae bacterium]